MKLTMFVPRTLRMQLGLLLLLAFAPVLGLTVHRALREQAQRLSETQAAELRVARQLATSYGDVIRRAQEALGVLVRVPGVRRLDGDACSSLVSELMQTNPQYANLSVARVDGEVF